MVLGIYVFGTLGINLCYHRLLTHRGFVCPKWVERTLVILAVCSFQDTRRAGSPFIAAITSIRMSRRIRTARS